MSEDRKFDEAAFDKAVAKPNGWSKVADPVMEIRLMRGDGDDENLGKLVLRKALSLVRAHFEGDEDVFLEKSRELAARLDEEGRGDLASFIRAQTGDEPSWVPMERKRQGEIDAILAEARNKYTVHDCNECDYRKSCDLRFDCDECKTKRESISLALGIEDDYFTKLLDRIEKAVDRERAIANIMLAVKDKPLPHPDPDNAPRLFFPMTKTQLQTLSDLVAIAHDKMDGLPHHEHELERFDALLADMKARFSADKPYTESAPGNAAALREALKSIEDDCHVLDRKDMWEEEGECYYDALRDIREKVSAALAAPARNCDRFATAEEAYAAWQKHNSLTAICDWLFAPAQEGKEAHRG